MDKRALKILLDAFWSPVGWKSEPMGELVLGKSIYEFHVGIVVLAVNKKSKVWSSKFTTELMESILEDDGSYKLFLLK